MNCEIKGLLASLRTGKPVNKKSASNVRTYSRKTVNDTSPMLQRIKANFAKREQERIDYESMIEAHNSPVWRLFCKDTMSDKENRFWWHMAIVVAFLGTLICYEVTALEARLEMQQLENVIFMKSF